jgi:hypothetical protein
LVYSVIKKRKNIGIENFKDVLEGLDNNKAFDQELDIFAKSVMPKFVNKEQSAGENR